MQGLACLLSGSFSIRLRTLTSHSSLHILQTHMTTSGINARHMLDLKDIFIKIFPSYLHEELHKTVYFIKPVKHSLLIALPSPSRKRAHDSHHIILWVSQFPTQSPNDSSSSLVLTPKRFGPRAFKFARALCSRVRFGGLEQTGTEALFRGNIWRP